VGLISKVRQKNASIKTLFELLKVLMHQNKAVIFGQHFLEWQQWNFQLNYCLIAIGNHHYAISHF
jgi:hypothetical protein